MRKFLVVGALFLMASAPGRAQMLLDISGGSVVQIGGSGTVGYSFSTSPEIPFVANAIGIWDEGADGLLDAHLVGLWTDTGVLLRSALLTNAATVVASGQTAGRWLFAPITPISLSGGTFVVGANYVDNSNDLLRWGVPGASTVPGITFLTSAAAGPAFQFPTLDNAIADGYFGPNLAHLNFGGAAAPEPGTLALMAVAGVVGIALRRRHV